VSSLYETHIPVSNLARSSAFYSKAVGLIPAFAQPERGVAFFWVGSKSGGMVGLWEPRSSWGWQTIQRHHCHFSIRMTRAELHAANRRLRRLNLIVRGFDGTPTREPSVIGWMPSAQLYFNDPDGHSIEFISLLDEPARPTFIGTWSSWRRLRTRDRSIALAAPARNDR
jgi:lactoylglutathione lyase